MRVGTTQIVQITSGSRSTEEIISLDLLKMHLGVTTDDMDDLISLWEDAAIEWAESFMCRSILERQHRVVLNRFPYGHKSAIKLPMGKTSSVDSIQYVSGGVTITLHGPSSGSPGGSDFQEDLTSESGGIVMPVRGGSWPSVDSDSISPVVVNITSGWESSNYVPSSIKHAIMFAVTDLLEIRGSTDSSVGNAGSMLTTRQALLSEWRILRINE